MEYGFNEYTFNPTLAALMVNAGAKYVRTDIKYELGTYNDYVFAGYLSYGIKAYGIIGKWSLPDAIRNTFTLEDWKTTVKNIATKFKGICQKYEIWNEIEASHERVGYMDSPEHYVDMLREAYTIIKSIDPEATVIGGALADPLSPTWGDAIFAAGAAQYMDAYSLHFYYPNFWELNFKNVVEYHSRISGGKPIWISEIGNLSRGGTETEATQENYLRIKFAQLLSASPQPVGIIWFKLYDVEMTDLSSFGLVRKDYTPKLAYYAFREFAPSTPMHILNLSCSGGGTINPPPGEFSYSEWSQVMVTAKASSLYMLDYWLLDGVNVGRTNPYTVIMNADHTLVAYFKRIPGELGVLDVHAFLNGTEIIADLLIGIETGETPYNEARSVGTCTIKCTFQEETKTVNAIIVSGQTTTVNFMFVSTTTPKLILPLTLGAIAVIGGIAYYSSKQNKKR